LFNGPDKDLKPVGHVRCMKKTCAMLSALLLMGLVMALPKPGITPDSWLYGFKRFFEDLDLAFTFNEVARAEKYFKYAELRLTEAKEMVERGRSEYARKLAEEYERMLNRSLEIAEKVGEEGVNVTEVVATSTMTHLNVLEQIYELVSEEARPAIKRAMEASRRGNERALSVLGAYEPERAVEISIQILEEKAVEVREGVGEYQRVLNRTLSIIERLKSEGVDTSRWEQQITEVLSTPGELGEVPGAPGMPEGLE